MAELPRHCRFNPQRVPQVVAVSWLYQPPGCDPAAEWAREAKAMFNDIDALSRGGVVDETFMNQQLAMLVFDTNRLEGTISQHHRAGPTMDLITSFLADPSTAEPEVVAWNAEGGREPGTLSASRQLFQMTVAARYLLVKQRNAPLSVDLLEEVHRLMMEGSIDARGKPLAAGRMRKHVSETVSADDYQFTPPGQVSSGMKQIISKFEEGRAADADDPITRATNLFYDVVTVHPFINGNGRLCRLLFAWSLMRDGFPFPVTFSPGGPDARQHYLDAINQRRWARYNYGGGGLNVIGLVSIRRVLCNYFDLHPAPPIAAAGAAASSAIPMTGTTEATTATMMTTSATVSTPEPRACSGVAPSAAAAAAATEKERTILGGAGQPDGRRPEAQAGHGVAAAAAVTPEAKSNDPKHLVAPPEHETVRQDELGFRPMRGGRRHRRGGGRGGEFVPRGGAPAV
jgi:fido (protein-threonine AMPylation protein)